MGKIATNCQMAGSSRDNIHCDDDAVVGLCM